MFTKIFKEKGVLLHEILELKEEIRNLKRENESDFLTGLKNRRFLFFKLKELCHKYSEDKNFGFLFVDVDGFKAVNDEHGHSAGG
jgi:diguanylate cyclase (GGDEF)-like protein